jgi:UPF0716 protein FxsA
MVRRLLLLYAVVELAVIIALVSTIGWGWTLLALLATFILGWGLFAPMAGSHLIRQLTGLRSGLNVPRSAVNDGAMVTLATILVLVPGLVTTALGILLMVPPIRAVAGPGLAAMAVRGLQRRVPLVTATMPREGRGDYIDGEVYHVRDVTDVIDVAPRELPDRRD